MKLLKSLKKIIHYNNQTDENNKNEDSSRIEKDESYEKNPIEIVQESKNPNRNNSEENNLKEKILEVENSRENNLEEKDPNELERENPENLITDSLKDIEVEYEIVEKEILPEKIICPDCGGITLEGLDFCDKCGGELYIYNR